MSLVAYESSEEESESETETTTDQARDIERNISKEVETAFTCSAIPHSSITSNTYLEQNQDTLHGKKSSFSLSSRLPPPKYSATINTTLVSNQSENGRHNGVSSTPETKLQNNINKQDNSHGKLRYESNSDEEEIIDIEEYVPRAKTARPEVKQKSKEETLRSVGTLFSLLPPPWKTEAAVEVKQEFEHKDVQTKKHPVRISIPTAPEVEADEEGDEPVSKKQKHTKVGSGLSFLLPKPKHSVTVKSNPNKPSAKLSNRPLIPYTLSKKSSATKTIHKKEIKTAQTEIEGEISDEDEPTSFFSFDDKKPEREVKQSVVSLMTSETVQSQESQSNDNSSMTVFSTNLSSTTSVESPNTEPLAAQTEKHSFNSAVDVSYDHEDAAASTGGESCSSATGPYYDVSPAETSAYYGVETAPQQNSYSYTGYSYNKSLPTDDHSQVEDYIDSSQAQPVIEQDHIDMEKLKRLQGKKNRGEKIDIIDINAHDQVGNNEIVMTKMATEEISHRPSKKKGDLPSSQQRRKHQITYLAHQAKEREFELRNQWASNRQTRKQTQSKYGF